MKGQKSNEGFTPPFQRLSGVGQRSDEVELGRVSGVFGVRGEVRLFLHNPSTELFVKPRKVTLIDGQSRRWSGTLKARSGAGKRILGRFTELTQREQAAEMKDWTIVILRSELPNLEEDEFYVWQLEGGDAFEGEERIGTIVTVHNTAGGDLFEVQIGDESHFVPYLDEYVDAVKADAGQVVFHPGALTGSEE